MNSNFGEFAKSSLPKLGLGVIGGGLISSVLNALFGVGATIAQNQYNSPNAQLKRIRKAGLPLSYMYQGKVNQQSDTPKLQLEPTLGTLQKIQGEKISAETTGQTIQNQTDQATQNFLRKKSKDGISNLEVNLRNERDIKKAELFLKQNQGRLIEIDKIVQDTLLSEGVQAEEKRQGLLKIQEQINLMGQLYKIRGFEEFVNNTITEDMDTLPEWQQALAAIILKLFHTKNFN